MHVSHRRITSLQKRSRRRSIVRFLFFALCITQFAEANALDTVRVLETDDSLQVSNDRVQFLVEKDEAGLNVVFQARDGQGHWRNVASQFRPDFQATPDGNAFFNTSVTSRRYAVATLFSTWAVRKQSDDMAVIELSGRAEDSSAITQTITLHDGSDHLHIEVSATLAEPKLDYLLSSLVFNAPAPPDFVHSPTAKRDDPRSGSGRDQVIGDHAFHAPAIILQQDALFVALVPDLDLINRRAVISPDARRTANIPFNKFSTPIEDDKMTMPTALDLNVVSGLTGKPVLSYGMMDFVIGHHVRYQRVNDPSMIRTLSTQDIAFGFDLFLGADTPRGQGYQKVVRHQWKRYGHPLFQQRGHLAMPFEEYVGTVYGIVSKPMDPKIQAPIPGLPDHGVFAKFNIGEAPVGGMVSPLGVLGFGDALWNFEFWNNARDAAGMNYWGRQLDIPFLTDMARRTVNLTLQSPQNRDGFFCLVYRVGERRWVRSSLGPDTAIRTIFAKTDTVYNIPAMSKTAAHLLEYYRQCEQNTAIIAFLSRYADGIIRHVSPQGELPSYYTEDMQPLEDLRLSAQPAATMWFLAELYDIKREPRYLAAAQRIAAYLERDILPQQRWIDLEAYYSCGQNPVGYLADKQQNLPIRGNLSAYWATRGFAALHRVTGKEAHLLAGERAIDYVSFTQACWEPHYVYTAFPFGGFTVDNIDTATWLDARQCEMVAPYIYFGVALGRQDLLERAVAAARSSTVLINLPRHRENNIYRHPNIYGFGLGPENINHEGHNQSAMRTHPGWGECSGIFTGLSDAHRQLGGAYVHLEKQIGVGVDGLRYEGITRDGNQVRVRLADKLTALQKPWDQSRRTMLILDGNSDAEPLFVAINDGEPVKLEGGVRRELPLTIDRRGRISPTVH